MIRKTSHGIHWLEFDLLAELRQMSHGIVLRHGGISAGPYGSLNVGDNVGDAPAAVEENRSRIVSALRLSHLSWIQQVHGTHIVHVTKGHDCSLEGDAMITTVPEIALMVRHADCQAALMVDPVRGVIAAVHAGWRGNVFNIYSKVVEHLKALGSHPANLLVGISPSLGPQHAEFIHYRQEFPESFWDYQVTPNHFDLWAIAHAQLTAAGVLPQHIEMARLCTYADSADYFSHRRDKLTGRHGSVMMLKAT